VRSVLYGADDRYTVSDTRTNRCQDLQRGRILEVRILSAWCIGQNADRELAQILVVMPLKTSVPEQPEQLFPPLCRKQHITEDFARRLLPHRQGYPLAFDPGLERYGRWSYTNAFRCGTPGDRSSHAEMRFGM
jgi:hypothetical protein